MKPPILSAVTTAFLGFMTANSAANQLIMFDCSRFLPIGATSGNDAASKLSSAGATADNTFFLSADGVVTNAIGGSKRYLLGNIKGGADIDAGSPSALASPANRQDAIGNIFAQHRCRESPLDPKSIEQLIVAAANKYGVDPKLATAVGWNESRFDRVRNSPKGARGPMQLVPDTARRFGVRDICDPASNIDGGVHYLRTLLDKFGNPLLAAAAYNAGEQAIYDHRGVPPFAETVSYLANILNYQMGLRAPSGSKSDPQQKLSRTDQPAPDTAGVIGASTRAKFIAGVMQF